MSTIKQAYEDGYEKGFLDGAQHQMKSSVDKAVNAMSQTAQEPVAWMTFNDYGGVQMRTVFELIEANELTLHGDIEHFAEVVVAENSAVLNKEIDRLKQQIRYQDQRDGRIGTHSPTCYSFGPHHYECALRKIEELEKSDE